MGDIATVAVISLDIDNTLSSALELMIEYEHRHIVVLDDKEFRLLSVMDIIKKQDEQISLQSSLKDMDLVKIPVIEKYKNVLDALELINDRNEHICVLNRDKSLYGFVTQSDIVANIDPETLMESYKLQDFLKLGRKVKMVDKDAITTNVLKEMVSNSIDNVVVVDRLKAIGILTTKDVMHLIKEQVNMSLPVSTYMSSPVETLTSSSSIKIALEHIKRKHFNRVVVVDEDGNFEGVVSQKELITLTYSKWASLMKAHQNELSEMNLFLEHKNKEYEVMATTDSLTGLYNRHKFIELYRSSYNTMIQRENKLSLILLDIDYFKKVNDSYGHNIGDNVLVHIAQMLLKTLRNIDIVCRWGGEEFILLLPATDLAQALKIAENIRINIQNTVIDRVGSVTVSLGVSEVLEGDTMNDVVQRADEALYLAKDSGRNCIKSELDIAPTL